MNVIEMNKYRPSLVRHARFLSQDWTSFSQIGEVWNGHPVTLDDYLAIEARYLRGIHRFLASAQVERLRIQGLESWTDDSTMNTSAVSGLIPRRSPNNGDEVAGESLDDLVRRCLRELAWMELAVPREFLLHVGYDLRVIVATTVDTSATEEAIRADGLFTYPGDRGIATLRQWDEDTEGTLAHWANRTKAGDLPSSRHFGRRPWPNEEDVSRLVDELQQSWNRGISPSGLLRELGSKGIVGGPVINVMQRAFGLSLAKTNAIAGWFSDGDDERIDRLLTPHMPDRASGNGTAT